jgi:hypothetical protein
MAWDGSLILFQHCLWARLNLKICAIGFLKSNNKIERSMKVKCGQSPREKHSRDLIEQIKGNLKIC